MFKNIDPILIKDNYPKSLETCLDLLQKIKYNSIGFPMVMLSYNYHFKNWTCVFRNPLDFSNPETKSDTAIGAVYKLLDFIIENKPNETENNS